MPSKDDCNDLVQKLYLLKCFQRSSKGLNMSPTAVNGGNPEEFQCSEGSRMDYNVL